MKTNASKRRFSAAAAVLAVLFGMTACAARTNDEAMDMSPSESAPSYDYEYGYSYDTSADSYYSDKVAEDAIQTGSAAAGSSVPMQPDSARKLIKTVSMDLETKEFDAFLTQLYDRVDAAGGYIQSSSIDGGRYYSSDYYSRYASVTVRIPADRLDAFCDGVAGISNVVSRREGTTDVTLEYYDTESHMKALQSEYETLVGILEKCTKLEDVISVQQRITTVLYQIESYKTTLNNYDNLVTYSTVTMSVQEVKEETIVTEQTVGERISSGFKSTIRDIREDAEDFLVDLVANLPYLVIWAVIIAAAVIAIRACIRRARKKRALRVKNASAPAGTNPPENPNA